MGKAAKNTSVRASSVRKSAGSTKASATVSLVMTTYNHARYIVEALDSVIAQDRRPDEIIVVDDGSTDDTARIAQDFVRQGVQIITRKNGGPSNAFNEGATQATGDILVLFSGDDVLTKNSIGLRVAALESGHCDIVCSPPIWISGDGRELGGAEHPPLFPQFGSLRPAEMFARLYYGGNFVCAPSVAMTRAAWKVAGPYNPELFQLQDYAAWLRAAGKGMRFQCSTEPFVRYRWHGGNLSSADNTWRSNLELESVWLDAPRNASHKILMEVLFGSELAELETPMTDHDLAMLVRAKHMSEIVRQHGRGEIQAAFHAQEQAFRLAHGVF